MRQAEIQFQSEDQTFGANAGRAADHGMKFHHLPRLVVEKIKVNDLLPTSLCGHVDLVLGEAPPPLLADHLTGCFEFVFAHQTQPFPIASYRPAPWSALIEAQQVGRRLKIPVLAQMPEILVLHPVSLKLPGGASESVFRGKNNDPAMAESLCEPLPCDRVALRQRR